MKSWILARFRTEQQRRDASSAALAGVLFCCLLYISANMNQGMRIREPGRPTTVKFQLLSKAEYDKLMNRELPSAIEKSVMAQKSEPKSAPAKSKPPVRESVLSKPAPPPVTPKIEQAEFRPAMAEPEMWEADRSEVDKKSVAASRAAAVDMPKPVNDPIQKLSDDKPSPIVAAIADVKQNVSMAAKTKELKAAEPVSPTDYQAKIAAPAEVVRKELARASDPSSAAPGASFPGDMTKKMSKEVDRKDMQAQVVVRESVAEREMPQDDPGAWREARRAAAEKHDAGGRSVDLPIPVKEKVESLAIDRPSPIQQDLAAVKQTGGLANRSVDLPKPAQQSGSSKIYVPQNVEAPQEVVRHESVSEYKPHVSAAPEAVNAPGVSRLARNVAAPHSPSTQVQLAVARPAVELPEVPAAEPANWKEARARTGDVGAQRRVQVNSVALPAAVAGQEHSGNSLSDRSRPVEVAMASISPSVELRRAESAGPAGRAARPVSTSEVVLHQSSAPVEVVRKKEVRQTKVFEASRQVDGLKVTGVKAMTDKSAASAVSNRAAPVPETAKDAIDHPDLPEAPQIAPDKWVDPARSARSALAEKSSIDAKPADFPNKIDPNATFTMSTPHYDVAVENVKSEFDVLPLSDRSVPAAPTSSGGLDLGVEGSDHRKLIKSEEFAMPQWFEEKGINSIGTFRVHIGPDGDVQSVEVEKTTGFKDIDASCISTILNWKYENGQTAVTKLVKVRMMLKK